MRFLDSWHEVFGVLSRNKLRTLLTALSVAWGIFMLVLLLAAGRGLQRGVEYDFRDDATNSLWIHPGKTALPYAGLPPGRSVKFQNADMRALVNSVDGIEHITGRYYLSGNLPISHGAKKGAFDVRGCHPDHLYLERTIMIRGRFINERDLVERRKVCVISAEIQKALFDPGQEVLGETINVRGVNYQVVGLYRDAGGEAELRKLYIPISTAQLVYHGSERLHAILYTMGNASLEQSERMVQQTRETLAQRHRFAADDPRAVRLTNNLAQFMKVTETFSWIRVFVWVVGIGTLFAGIVGVSNVMLISVQERTVELGIRKAVGATPSSIVTLVLQEALLITSLAGYLGLLAATLVVEVVRRYVPENDYLREPQVDFSSAMGATVALIVAGAIAGLVPAIRAASIKPVVAMRRV